LFCLAPEFHKVGKLRLQAYKDACTKEFTMCNLQLPRKFGQNFLSLSQNTKLIKNLTSTCAVISFEVVKNKVTKLELLETNCEDKFPSLCEYEPGL
jgi:hypothetical protein